MVEYGGSYELGEKVHETVVFGGQKVRIVGSNSEIGERLIVPPSYNLLIRVTNKAGTTTNYSVEIKWWEDVLS